MRTGLRMRAAACLVLVAAAAANEAHLLVMDPRLPLAFVQRRNRIAQGRDDRHPNGRIARAAEIAPGLECEHGECRAAASLPSETPRSNVKVSLAKGSGLTFCVDCRDPHDEGGSWMPTWEGHYSVDHFHIHGVPNDLSSKLAIKHVVHGQVVLADRGGTSLNEKARFAQQAGAAALVIVDSTGECDAAFNCGPLTGSKSEGGLAYRDYWPRWRDIVLPVAMVTKGDGDRLKRVLNLAAVEFPEHGLQLVNGELA